MLLVMVASSGGFISSLLLLLDRNMPRDLPHPLARNPLRRHPLARELRRGGYLVAALISTGTLSQHIERIKRKQDNM
jgi:hypothetical protein